mgnify:FL=1
MILVQIRTVIVVEQERIDEEFHDRHHNVLGTR